MNSVEHTVLALDAHGGDHGPAVTVPAALDALLADRDLYILLAGLPADLEPLLAEADPTALSRLELTAASQVLNPDARPVSILRKGQGSSLWTAMQAVAEGRAHACVSAGSTVALMTLGVKLLGMLPGIKRPALMSQIPTAKGMTSMLDLGANLNVDAGQLVQFAIMGAVVRAASDRDNPSIGLLNVGHEDSKGHAVVRDAHERLRSTSLNYTGFIEGYDIFAGGVDVAVCDGFAGNLILKSSEGLASMLFGELRGTLDADWRTRAGAWLAKPRLRQMLERLDPAKHNGAPLLGLSSVVVKSHGNAARFALRQAIIEAGREARRHVPDRIEQMVKTYEAETTS